MRFTSFFSYLLMESITLASSTIVPIMPSMYTHNWRADTLEKKQKKNKSFTYELVYDLENLYIAFSKSKEGCVWKNSVQQFEKHALLNCYDIHKRLITMSYAQKKFHEFTLCERGKTRRIKAMYIDDRVVQRCLSDRVLTPIIKDYLIYDNGASLEQKGVDFCRKRLETHLHKFHRQHGTNGYVLLIDFSKFFDNLLHAYVRNILHMVITDEKLKWLIDLMIDSFRIDASYMDDDEYLQCLLSTFNSIDYNFLSHGNQSGEKFMDKSVGIGSHLSQICGVFYPSEIDNFCKIVKGIKYYGRYMDDIYIIHEDKEFLKNLLKEVNEMATNIGLTINMKKTQITPLSRPFAYLQIKYHFTETGHLVRRLTRKNFVRERRRLKAYRNLIEKEQITYYEVGCNYSSWRGMVSRYDSYRSVQEMDEFFHQTFNMTYEECMDSGIVHFAPEVIGLPRAKLFHTYKKLK